MDTRTNLWALAAILAAIGILAWAMPGHCAYCYPYACFDSTICGPGCVCAKINGGLQGICAAVN